MSDIAYIYGESNGASYKTKTETDEGYTLGEEQTHWDPRLEIRVIAGTVQIGIVPASDDSTKDRGVWKNDDGQFLSLSRSGLQRLIVAARDCRDAAYGKDE